MIPARHQSTTGSWVTWILAAGLTLSLLNAEVALAAEALFAKVANVSILSRPDPKGPVLAKLEAGAEVVGLQKKGLYWQVKAADGTTGFVMMTLLSTRSAAVGAQLSGAMRSLLTQKREGETEAGTARARSKNAVMGIRGLASEDLSQVGNLRPNTQALEMLESWSVSAASVQELEAAVLAESMTAQ
jgi:hypothetical protein